MKLGVIITILIFSGMFVFIVKQLYKEWKEGRSSQPEDILFDLNFKIMYSIVCNHSELYLIKLIKEYRIRPDINKEKLEVLEMKFIRRFCQLHEIDEYSPENLSIEENMKIIKLRQKLDEIEETKFGDFDHTHIDSR